jgi:hypothetical protein
MRYLLIVLGLCTVTAISAADEPAASTPAPASAPAPITNVSQSDGPAATDGAVPHGGTPPEGSKAAAKFTTDAKWETAGYNNDEIVYTILVTSHDSRIIRCTTSLQGSYYENGQKQTVSDRQLSTVFPDQQVQVGNWMGMDQQSGATYSVHCHAI